MKRTLVTSIFRKVAAAAVVFVPLGTSIAVAQEAQPVPQAQQGQRTVLSAQQLDNLVAPLALYPDPLLSQVLVAATYPLEVVQANQWLQENRQLTGTALMDAAKQQNWDPSVQALVAFPDVLTRLNQDVRWTTDLGNAFLAQQADVMSSIQRLRARAKASGKLQSTPQETVTTTADNGQTAIAIQPADPQVIYVPTYDPTYIWGPPAYGFYPGLFYPTYGFGFGFGIPIGGFFGGWGGWGGWGWGFNWYGRGLYVNGGFFGHYGYGFRGGYGGGFAGNRGWSHDYARSSRAVGASAGYSRSYATAAGSRGFAGNNGRSAGAGQSARSGAAGQGYRGGAAGSSVNRGYAGQSTARSYAGGSAGRGYSAPSARSYSAPSRSYGGSSSGRSYSAPSRSYGGGGAARSSGGGGFHGGGGGGGSHGGGGHR